MPVHPVDHVRLVLDRRVGQQHGGVVRKSGDRVTRGAAVGRGDDGAQRQAPRAEGVAGALEPRQQQWQVVRGRAVDGEVAERKAQDLAGVGAEQRVELLEPALGRAGGGGGRNRLRGAGCAGRARGGRGRARRLVALAGLLGSRERPGRVALSQTTYDVGHGRVDQPGQRASARRLPGRDGVV